MGQDKKVAAYRHDDLLAQHGERLAALIEALRATEPLDSKSYGRLTRRFNRGDGAFRKSDIIHAFRRLAPLRGWTEDQAAFIAKLRMKPGRTASGVATVTVLTRPHPCPGHCVFCPSDVKMPKSYLSLEPGAQRAARYHFDPYMQTWNRLRALFENGHVVNKVELIVLGGSWTAYPLPYQIWFVKRCFDALNDFEARSDLPHLDPPEALPMADIPVDGRNEKTSYNAVIIAHLRRQSGGLERNGEAASWADLEGVQRRNESACARCVGLSLETRPDELAGIAAVKRLRRLGATKVQIGYQSLDDRILANCRRGHDVAATRRAMTLLRQAGFKVHAHWMPNLPGATPESDRQDFARIFADPDFRPDELKIYPCCLIENSPLIREFEAGRWRPYEATQLFELLVDVMADTPQYCRLTRVIRDIPSQDILAGNKVNNLRQQLETEIHRRGIPIREIRSRQIRRPLRDLRTVHLQSVEYAVGTGRELFFQGVTERDELVGFLRLFLPRTPSSVAELGSRALLRELHVYGTVAGLGDARRGAAQHLGLGKRLIAAAVERARGRGYTNLAVISAVGTRNYYRRNGFVDGVLYQHRSLCGAAGGGVRANGP